MDFNFSKKLNLTGNPGPYNPSSFLFTNTLTSCDTADIGIDITTYFAGGSNGCDSTVVTITSLQSPVLNSGLAAYYIHGCRKKFMTSAATAEMPLSPATLTQDRHGNANSAMPSMAATSTSTDHDPSPQLASSSWRGLHFKTNATGTARTVHGWTNSGEFATAHAQ